MNQAISLQDGAVKSNSLGLILELTKARLTALVLVTNLVGYLLAARESIDWITLLWTFLGTGLAAGGANAWNQWWEARRDACMERTRRRPLPSGKMKGKTAFLWSAGLSFAGAAILAIFANILTAMLAVIVIVLYVLVYTPLKPRSSLCTLVGAVCGAIPPMMGWTAATGSLDYGAWILGAILFVWQIPHFLALAWLYREDYAQGGFRMLPIIDPSGRTTCQLIVLYSLALIPLGLAATIAGLAGWLYALGSILLGIAMVFEGVRFSVRRRNTDARRLFLASILYLPLLLAFMVADQGSVHDCQTIAEVTIPSDPIDSL